MIAIRALRGRAEVEAEAAEEEELASAAALTSGVTRILQRLFGMTAW